MFHFEYSFRCAGTTLPFALALYMLNRSSTFRTGELRPSFHEQQTRKIHFLCVHRLFHFAFFPNHVYAVTCRKKRAGRFIETYSIKQE